MVTAYTARRTEERPIHEVWFFRDQRQHEGRLKAFASALDAIGSVEGAVLDVGCGTGELLRWHRPSHEYLGVDAVPRFVEEARSSFPRHRFACGDVLAGAWLARTNTVVMAGLLGMSPQPLELLQRAAELATRHLVFDYLMAGGTAEGYGPLRTLSDSVTNEILSANNLHPCRQLQLGTSGTLVHAERQP
jgi:SAM-dependent methyltransferase